MLAHSPAITAQSTADDLASLLCSLLCYTLTSLLCTSCSFLQHAAQRHSRAILPVRHAIAKRLRARVPLRHRAPFATCKADTCGTIAPSPTPPTSCSHSETIATDTRGIRPRHLRADHLPPHDPCSLTSSTRAPADHSHHLRLAHAWPAPSTTSSIVFGNCPVGSRALPRPHLCEARAGGCTRRAHENTRNSRPLRPVNHRPRPRAAITIPTAVCSLHAYIDSHSQMSGCLPFLHMRCDHYVLITPRGGGCRRVHTSNRCTLRNQG
jgi:hypothetical protein